MSLASQLSSASQVPASANQTDATAPGGIGAQLSSKLLEAWHDNVAGVTAYSGAITTVSLFGDGHRLVIADEDRKLKV
jgi:hypothetical protein